MQNPNGKGYYLCCSYLQHPVFTILDVNRPSVVAQTLLTPAQPIGEHLIGTDEAAASSINSIDEEEPETPQFPSVSIAREGIGEDTFQFSLQNSYTIWHEYHYPFV